MVEPLLIARQLKIQFDLGTPFKPIEQLLCVLPAARHFQFLPFFTY